MEKYVFFSLLGKLSFNFGDKKEKSFSFSTDKTFRLPRMSILRNLI